jgi:D-alanine transaminase
MADVLYINGRFTTTDEKVIGVEDRGFQFADAIYEVFKFIGRRPAFLREHYARLQRSLAALEIPLPFDFDQFRFIIADLLQRTAFADGIVYIQITRGDTPRVHIYPDQLAPTVVMYSRSFTFPDASRLERGISVITLPELRWRRCDIKSVNLLPNAMAKKKANRADADESIFCSDGLVREGASSNFFAVFGERLITHPADEQVLAGVVRDQVISLALAKRIRVDERPLREDELLTLDEAFITSTTQGVMPVTAIDGRTIRNGRRGELTQELQEELLRRELEDAKKEGGLLARP